MATPGHPYETKALDEQRARQRLLLAGLPDTMVFATATADNTILDGDAGIESALRRHADHLASLHEVAATLERYREIQTLEAIRRVSLNLHCKADDFRDPFANTEVVQPPHAANVALEEPTKRHLLAWILYATEADRYASDGYRDARLVVRPKPATAYTASA